ncbi:Porphobilinogen deaminase [Streptomyces sp. ADI96-02]|nr:Porphobilinogen deaminase [Streptomyces sp. ADI96-02]
MPADLIRIVSRDSPMALAQVERVRAELAALHPGTRTEVVPVRTTGDKWMGDLSAVEGKGAFTKEVDAALLAGEADLAVHCVKDIPADRPLPAGTAFAAFLERDDIRDVLIHPGNLHLDELPAGTRIGTSSVRRTAQLAASHPHLVCVPMRGNADRRLEKLPAGEADMSFRGTATVPSPVTPKRNGTATCRSGPRSSPPTARSSSTPTNGPERSTRPPWARRSPSACCARGPGS